jgi:hypothetical protein
MTLYFWNSYIKRSIVVLSCSSDLLIISLPEPGGFTGSLQAVPQSTGQQMVSKILPFIVHFISIKPVLNDHLSYVIILHYSLGTSHNDRFD